MAVDRSPIRVVGRYALYNEIAAGGMATIHLGRLLGPVGFARTVAVKRLHPQFAKDPEFVSMFLDEARLAARVQHPNVVATLDVVATDGELFLIMDYIRGESLSKILRELRKSGQLVPPRIAAAIMCGFLHGLHAAHEAKNERGEPLGLVHRDVSPQNVLVGSDGIARVLDFGVAKAQGRIQVTRDGEIKGKLAYMPPEQLGGGELTRAVDIYASAVVMWETLTTERLFKGETEAETLVKILRDPVPAPSSFVASLPRSYDRPLLRALSRHVRERHASARELALDLEKCCGIASPREVGEWVEEIVGRVLNAREDQIAEIESSSVGMIASQHVTPGVPDSDSNSDVSSSLTSQAMRVMSSRVDTLTMGSGPPSSRRRGNNLVREASAAEEGSKSRTGMFTGTRFMLPVDRKLPVIASIAGILVLLVVVTAILAGKFSGDAESKPITSSTALAPSADPSAVAAAIPDPSSAAETPPPSTETVGTPQASAARTKPAGFPAYHPTAKAVGTPVKASATPTATVAKKNCDPPWTLDAQGRRKYKLECM